MSTNTNFLHPADAMRAKIEGKLNCSWCTSFHKKSDAWCTSSHKAPFTKTMLKDQFCLEFEQREQQIDLHPTYTPDFHDPGPNRD